MTQFETLLNEVEGQSEESLISFFFKGLKPKIKKKLKLVWPPTLRKALTTANVYEANKKYKGRKGGGCACRVKTEPLIKTALTNTLAVHIVRRTLMIEEKEERLAKALYSNCDE